MKLRLFAGVIPAAITCRHQTVLSMKLVIVLCAFSMLQVTAKGYGQSISLSFNKAPIENVFKEIKRQTGYRFIYTREEIKQAKPVSIDLKNASIEAALLQCFLLQPLQYIIEDKYVIVTVKQMEVINAPGTKTIDVSGQVMHEDGNAAAGVTVKLKGGRIMTATDNSGVFYLKGVPENGVLVFSGTDVEDFEIKIDGQSEIRIKLRTKVSQLDAVQIIAYGTTSKKLNTGNVSKVNNDEIACQPVANPIAALQGRAAGLFVTTQNGLPGGNISVIIRGRGSLNSGTDPLYVVDGVPFSSTALNGSYGSLAGGINGSSSPLNSINPADIESIEILKDADATAIYGSRAANGVILITTKKAKPGKTSFSANIYSGISQLANFPELLNMKDYLTIRREGFANDGRTPTVNNAPELLVWDTTRGVNWPKYMMGGKAPLVNVQAGISGGNEQINFLLTGNYRREGSILPGNSSYSRGGFRIMLRNQSLNKRFNLEFAASYADDRNNQLGAGIFSILTLPPNLPIYKADGSYNWTGIVDNNPAAVQGQQSRSNTNNFLSNAILRYRLPGNIELKTSIGYTRIQMDQVMVYPKSSMNPNFGQDSYAYYGDNRNELVVAEPQLLYTYKKNKHSINAVVGFTWQYSKREGSFITGTNYSNENLLEYAGAAGSITATNDYAAYKYASVFTRLQYQFNEKYLLSLNGRRDGSSKFGPGKEFGNFGSIGAGWIFTKEKVFEGQRVLSYGKLRGSYGITGNDQIPDYQYLSTYGSSGSLYQGVSGLQPLRIANSNFGWETNRKLEASLELGFFKNSILLNAVYYQNRSGNQLIEYPLPYTSGPFGRFIGNLPALIENKGWEFDFTAAVIRNSRLNWMLTGNITIPKNKLLAYPDLLHSSYANTYVIGEDVNIKQSLKFTGIDVATGIPVYADINKDGVISLPEDYTITGRTSPYYYGGAGSEWKYGPFSFSVFFQFSKQYAQGLSTIPGTRSNKFSIALERWQKPGDETSIAKATTLPSGEYFYLAQSDASFYNASFVRLKNISLGYALPEKLLKRMKIGGCRIYAEAQNLVTWRKRANLYDPETTIYGVAPLKTIVAGIDLTF